MKDIFGKALSAYFHGNQSSKLILHNKFSEPDELELDGYFFEVDELTDLELIALDFFKGKIADIGAATGRHTLYLQSQENDVTAIELSNNCIELMKERDVKNTIHSDYFQLTGVKFDTLLLLMNGIGIAGSLTGYKSFLKKANELLNPDGILIFDSSDVSYLKNEYQLPVKDYFGEIDYCYEWETEQSDWFTWLYMDQKTLTEVSEECGWNAQIVFEEEDGQYLAILTKN